MISRKYLLIIAAVLLAVALYVVYSSKSNATSDIKLGSAVEVDTAVNATQAPSVCTAACTCTPACNCSPCKCGE